MGEGVRGIRLLAWAVCAGLVPVSVAWAQAPAGQRNRTMSSGRACRDARPQLRWRCTSRSLGRRAGM